MGAVPVCGGVVGITRRGLDCRGGRMAVVRCFPVCSIPWRWRGALRRGGGGRVIPVRVVVFVRRAVWLSKRFYSCGCVLVGVKRSGGVCIYAGQSVFGCWVVVVFVVGVAFVLVRAFLLACFW